MEVEAPCWQKTLAVGVGSRAAFAEAVVRLGVHGLCAADLGQVFLALAHVLAALHHHGAQAQLDEAQGGKEAAGTGTHDDDLRASFHVGVVRMLVFVVLGHFVDVGPHGEVHEDRPLAGVDAPLQDAGGVEGSLVKAFLAYEIGFQSLFFSRQGLSRVRDRLSIVVHWLLPRVAL